MQLCEYPSNHFWKNVHKSEYIMADKGFRDLALTLRVGRVYRIASFLSKMWTKPPPNPKTCLTYATPQS